tara:strand:+ start:1200 stop:1910 length:711 start_codon:yes stop_codon:yes gene_type:complete
MRCSESTAALDAALAKAQQQLKPAVKTARGHGYDYAALEEVTESAVEALSANGISFSQGIEETEDGKLRCVTRLSKDGEWIITYCPLRVATKGRNNEMQELGSAYTYGRRYALQALVGIAPITRKDFEKRKAREEHSWGQDDDGASSGPAQHSVPVKYSKKNNAQAKKDPSPKGGDYERTISQLEGKGVSIHLLDSWMHENKNVSLERFVEDYPEKAQAVISWATNDKNIEQFQEK